MYCTHCQSDTQQIKKGKNASGSQRYFCKHCSRTYTPVPSTYPLKSIEVCAGGGGLALGLEQAGFHHVALVEIDRQACATLRKNRPEWQVLEIDLYDFHADDYEGIDLLSGGVPCPPFSVAGKQLGEDDERNLFDEMIRLVAECSPKAVLIENVRGLLDTKFDAYREKVTKKFETMDYIPFWTLLNACDFGVPQLRPRTLFVALKREYAWSFQWPTRLEIPAKTVGEALYEEMRKDGWIGAEAWKEQANTIAPTVVGGSKKHGGPDLGPTRARKAWEKLGVDGRIIANAPPEQHFIGMPNLTVAMTAILQGFPESWEFVGKKTPAYRQVGNAFPPPVAKAVGEAIARVLTHPRPFIDKYIEQWQENPDQEISYVHIS